jgi:hypothetical protein
MIRALLSVCYILVPRIANSSTLKEEAIFRNIGWLLQRYICTYPPLRELQLASISQCNLMIKQFTWIICSVTASLSVSLLTVQTRTSFRHCSCGRAWAVPRNSHTRYGFIYDNNNNNPYTVAFTATCWSALFCLQEACTVVPNNSWHILHISLYSYQQPFKSERCCV